LEQSCPGVILENLGITDVPAQGIDRFVARHVHHLENARAALRGRRDESAPQRVAGEQRGIEADILGVSLDDIGDRLRGQSRADLAAFPDRAKQRALRDPSRVAPRLYGLDRARDRAAHDGDHRAAALLVRF
jgi:hypothetical protein